MSVKSLVLRPGVPNLFLAKDRFKLGTAITMYYLFYSYVDLH